MTIRIRLVVHLSRMGGGGSKVAATSHQGGNSVHKSHMNGPKQSENKPHDHSTISGSQAHSTSGNSNRSSGSSTAKRNSSSNENEGRVAVYDGEKSEDGRRRHGVFRYPDGCIFEGTYTDDVRTDGILTYANGDVYEGSFQGDNCHGHGKLTSKAGDIYIGSFGKGRKHGLGELT